MKLMNFLISSAKEKFKRLSKSWGGISVNKGFAVQAGETEVWHQHSHTHTNTHTHSSVVAYVGL